MHMGKGCLSCTDGILSSERLRGKEILSLSYTREWLDSGYGQHLNPALHYIRARNIRMLIKIVLEYFWIHQPDRWGRLLMRRREFYLFATNAGEKQDYSRSDR